MLQAGDLDEARGMAQAGRRGAAADGDAICTTRRRALARTPRPSCSRRASTSKRDESWRARSATRSTRRCPRRRELMSPEDQKKMTELAERQQAARKRGAGARGSELGKRAARARRQADEVPMPREMQDGLKQAGQHMERAEDKLRERDAARRLGRGGAGAREAEQDEGADAAASGGRRSSRRAGASTRSR